jgi:acetyl-CoA acetyltransferase
MQSLLRRSFSSSVPSAALSKPAGVKTVLVDGCRVPFMLSGTTYNNLMCHDLGRKVLKGLITRTAIDPGSVDYISMGTVIQEGACTELPLRARGAN